MKAANASPACYSIEWFSEAHKLTAQLKQLVDSLRSRAHHEASFRALSLQDVLAQTNNSKSTHYKLIQDGMFPAPFHVGRSSRWLQRDVDAWLEARSGSTLCQATAGVSK